MDIQKKTVAKKIPSDSSGSVLPSEEAFFFFSETEKQQVSFPAPKGPRTFAEETLYEQDYVEFLSRQPATTDVPITPATQSVAKNFYLSKKTWRFPAFLRKSCGVLGIIFLLLGAYVFWQKDAIEKEARSGVTAAMVGAEALQRQDFSQAQASFQAAEYSFVRAQRRTMYFPNFMARFLVSFPGAGRAMSGILALDAGKHLAEAGQQSTNILKTLSHSKEAFKTGKEVSLLSLMEGIAAPAEAVNAELIAANSSLKAIKSSALPEEDRLAVELLQQGVPSISGALGTFLETRELFDELLGKNGPRTYLFLFQNNQELRPTGGFIGTYGILEFKNGHARRFFIDGIFNPDGQLRENIVPPKPIQKISAGWSLHDSNWFPHFPLSAEKAIFFYEKTGGPTVDGVFTLTPSVMERLLVLTGPIELPEYELVVDGNNFIPTIQEQVEVKYDKTENKPKKVISDLASILMERVFSATDPVLLYQMASILVDGLNERQILLYVRNESVEQRIRESGWSGEQVDSPHDYLSVVHTNINGYKTDGVVDESVDHRVTISDDGSVIAEVSVTRKHTGGNTPYDWWNRVNSDYMRVYVPLGSKLLKAEGHTREVTKEPLDYDALNFKRDADVVVEESKIVIDEESGTRIGEEAHKTVFGNWVYVSPGESVVVKYTYLLPFRVKPSTKGEAGYSLLLQKQPGVKEFDFTSIVDYPDNWNPIWQTGAFLLPFEQSGIKFQQKAKTDLFYGMVFAE